MTARPVLRTAGSDKYVHGRFYGFLERCPHCGQPRSHGLPGNPDRRRVPPCQTPLARLSRGRA